MRLAVGFWAFALFFAPNDPLGVAIVCGSTFAIVLSAALVELREWLGI